MASPLHLSEQHRYCREELASNAPDKIFKACQLGGAHFLDLTGSFRLREEREGAGSVSRPRPCVLAVFSQQQS